MCMSCEPDCFLSIIPRGKILFVADTAVTTSRTEILEWVQHFPMQIHSFSQTPIWKFLVVKTALSNAVFTQSIQVYSNQGCSTILPSKLERICSLFWHQCAKEWCWLTAVMAWAVIFTALILNHGFLCFLMCSGFNKCLSKYETQETAVARYAKCRFYMHFKHGGGHGLNTFTGKKEMQS